HPHAVTEPGGGQRRDRQRPVELLALDRAGARDGVAPGEGGDAGAEHARQDGPARERTAGRGTGQVWALGPAHDCPPRSRWTPRARTPATAPQMALVARIATMPIGCASGPWRVPVSSGDRIPLSRVL